MLWLLIAESKAQKPSFIASWRQQRFGRLMLIMLIKQSTSLLLSHNGLSHCQDKLPCVVMYLQCPHKDPMEFYWACGFLQINLQDTTCIELQPKTIAELQPKTIADTTSKIQHVLSFNQRQLLTHYETRMLTDLHGLYQSLRNIACNFDLVPY